MYKINMTTMDNARQRMTLKVKFSGNRRRPTGCRRMHYDEVQASSACIHNSRNRGDRSRDSRRSSNIHKWLLNIQFTHIPSALQSKVAYRRGSSTDGVKVKWDTFNWISVPGKRWNFDNGERALTLCASEGNGVYLGQWWNWSTQFEDITMTLVSTLQQICVQHPLTSG